MIQLGKLVIFGRDESYRWFSINGFRYETSKHLAFRVLIPQVGIDTPRPNLESLFENPKRMFKMIDPRYSEEHRPQVIDAIAPNKIRDTNLMSTS